MDAKALPVVWVGQNSRSKRLADELRFALRQVPRAEVLRCLVDAPVVAGEGLVRRARRTAGLVKKVAGTTGSFVREGIAEVKADRGREFVAESLGSAKVAATGAAASAKQIPGLLAKVASQLRSEPSAVLPEMVGGVLGVMIGSGGLDADGGIADLDLAAGIGAHRSILTHSILIGAAAEGGLVALDRLVLLTHQHLPEAHDPIWDALKEHFSRATKAAQVGVAAGLAYHLAVDGTIQAAPYKDLPIGLPMEGHQAVFVGNAAVEGLDAHGKTKG